MPSSPKLAAALEQIDADFDDHLERIRDFLRIPSVSQGTQGMDAGAEATAELIEGAGGSAEVVPTQGHPAVLGSIDGRGARLLRYAMYDVQPTEEPDWMSDPFAAELAEVDGVGRAVVARGAANSKGTLAATLLAISSARKVDDLPAGITMLVDGEEELGSPNLGQVVASRRAELAADAAFDLDLMADRAGTSEVFLGCKGILSLHLTCRGGDWGGPQGSALHSSLGVLVRSPGWSVARALGALVGPDESVAIPGIETAAIPPEDEPFIADLVSDLDVDELRDEVGTLRLKHEGADRRALVEALLYQPAVSLNGIAGGYAPGGKTIIPHAVEAEVDFRVPYGNDIGAAAQAARAAIDRVAPEVEVSSDERCLPARTSADSHVARAMVASHRDMGTPARVWPSAPWWAPYYLFESVLGLPFAIGGAGHAGGAHAANEYASVEGLRAHMHHAITFLYRFADGFEASERMSSGGDSL